MSVDEDAMSDSISASLSAAPKLRAAATPDEPPLGIIEEVHGPVIDILCSRLAPLHRTLYVYLGDERYTLEVHRHLDMSSAAGHSAMVCVRQC